MCIIFYVMEICYNTYCIYAREVSCYGFPKFISHCGMEQLYETWLSKSLTVDSSDENFKTPVRECVCVRVCSLLIKYDLKEIIIL